jgi:hypothetical protein
MGVGRIPFHNNCDGLPFMFLVSSVSWSCALARAVATHILPCVVSHSAFPGFHPLKRSSRLVCRRIIPPAERRSPDCCTVHTTQRPSQQSETQRERDGEADNKAEGRFVERREERERERAGAHLSS